MTGKEIVRALRCRARYDKATNEGCKKCPYWATENLEEWQKLCGWASCKVYQIISDAADAIERLTAENAALREKKRWISVTEKTPEYDMPQLALNADGDALIANYAYGEWFDTWGQDVEVTHWMPLPEAPEEGEKEDA